MSSLKLKVILVNTLLFLTIILNNSFITIVILTLLFFVCMFFFSSYTISLSKVIFLLIILTSLGLNFRDLDTKNFIRVLQILIAFSLFPLKIDRSVISTRVLGCVMIFIAFMTLANVLEMGFEQYFKKIFYPVENNPWASDFSFIETGTSIFLNRYATFFYNPNILGQTTLLILLIYMIVKHNVKKELFDYLVLVLGVFCLIVSGGRTSFLIFAIIIFFTVIWKMKGVIKYLFVFAVIPFIIYQFLDTRVLQIVSADESMNSVGFKFAIFLTYLEKNMSWDISSIMTILFGTMKSEIQFDNDIGTIFYFFGVLGLLYFVFFFIKEFFSAKAGFRPYHAFVLITISATIIFNFKFLILSIIIFSMLKKGPNSVAIQK